MSLINQVHASTRLSSDLSKHSAEVFAEAEDHAVQITRRDGAPLVLMSQREADARASLLQFAADLITVTLDHDGSLAERFPWMLALSSDDRVACAQDLVDAARASFATGQPHLAVAELTSWRETATAIAAGLSSGPVEWFMRLSWWGVLIVTKGDKVQRPTKKGRVHDPFRDVPSKEGVARLSRDDAESNGGYLGLPHADPDGADADQPTIAWRATVHPAGGRSIRALAVQADRQR